MATPADDHTPASPLQPLTPGPQMQPRPFGATNPFDFGLPGTIDSANAVGSNTTSPFAHGAPGLVPPPTMESPDTQGGNLPTNFGRTSYTFPSPAHPGWMNVAGTPSVAVGQPTSAMPYVFVMVPPGAPFVPPGFSGPVAGATMPGYPTAPPTLGGPFLPSEVSSTLSSPQKKSDRATTLTPLPDETDEGPKQLIVNFLDIDVTNADLHAAFSAIGPLDAARVIYDKETNESKGFGFVYYHRSADARTAIQCMTGHPLRGRRIKVSYANPQRPVKRASAPDRAG